MNPVPVMAQRVEKGEVETARPPLPPRHSCEPKREILISGATGEIEEIREHHSDDKRWIVDAGEDIKTP